MPYYKVTNKNSQYGSFYNFCQNPHFFVLPISWGDLQWTSLPTCEFCFGQSLTHIGWEIFSWGDLSMDVFANFRILLLAIFDAHVLRDFFVERSSSTKGGSVQELPSLVSLTERSSGFEVSPNRGHQRHRRPRIPLVHAPSQAKSARGSTHNKTCHKNTISHRADPNTTFCISLAFARMS